MIMKTLALLIAIIFITDFAIGQEVERNKNSRNSDSKEIKTLFGKNNKTGGYGGFSFGYSEMAGINTLTAGGMGGIIIGQHLTIGIAGKGFSTDYSWETTNTTTTNSISGGYGGILIEPIIAPRFPVHISLPMTFGAGGVAGYSKYYDTANEYWRFGPYQASAFIYFEGSAQIEFNLTRFFRMALGATYRLTSNTKISGLTNNNLEGLDIDLVFKFGKF